MKIPREKIALLIFAVLLVVVGLTSIGYFYTSRNFNVAASYVDDQVGSLGDYTVVVYNGTVEPKEEKGDETDPSAFWLDGCLSTDKEGSDAQKEEGSRILDLGDAKGQLGGKIFLSEVNDLYREKGASVLSLDLSQPGYYDEPQVFTVGDRKIGVLEIDYYVSDRKLRKITDQMREEGATAIICITRTTALIASPASVDVLIVTSAEKGVTPDGAFVDGCFIVRTPEVGSIGALVINHANVVSARITSPE